MATLVNEGLVVRAKLTCGNATGATSFTKIALTNTTYAEAATVAYADISSYIITTNGGAEAVCDTHAYEANYKAKWVHLFSFSGDLSIYAIILLNTDDALLMYHLLPVHIEVHNGETAQITITETESTV